MHAHDNKVNKLESKALSTESSPLQTDSAASTFQFIDKRPASVAQRKLQEKADNSPLLQTAAKLQEQADHFSTEPTNPVQKKGNDTGLPDQLKAGIENMSGYSMDDVKVHYGSDKPAQLQAHAFAQGTDIHLGPGKEKHLPHEAWHVVQQKQGRVKPTTQMKGEVNVNDDAGLEKEADVMGAQASNIGRKNSPDNPSPALKSTFPGSVQTVQKQPIFQTGTSWFNSDSWEGSEKGKWRSEQAKEEWSNIIESFEALKKLSKSYAKQIITILDTIDLENDVESAQDILNKYHPEDKIVPYHQAAATQKELTDSIEIFETAIEELKPHVEEANRRKEELKQRAAAIIKLNKKLGIERNLGLTPPEDSVAKDEDSIQEINTKSSQSIARAEAQRTIDRDVNNAAKLKREEDAEEEKRREEKKFAKSLKKEEAQKKLARAAQSETDRERSKALLQADRKRIADEKARQEAKDLRAKEKKESKDRERNDIVRVIADYIGTVNPNLGIIVSNGLSRSEGIDKTLDSGLTMRANELKALKRAWRKLSLAGINHDGVDMTPVKEIYSPGALNDVGKKKQRGDITDHNVNFIFKINYTAGGFAIFNIHVNVDRKDWIN